MASYLSDGLPKIMIP